MGAQWEVVGLCLLVLHISGVSSECATCTGACSRDNVDVTFVVDGSGSLCGPAEAPGECRYWRRVLEFLSQVVGGMNVGLHADRVALVQFSNVGRKEFGLLEHLDLASLQAAILKLEHMAGNTNTSGGLSVMRKEVFGGVGDRPNKTNIAVVITDGMSTYDHENTIPEALQCAREGIRIYVVGVTDNIDQNEVRRMSAAPQTVNMTYFVIPHIDDLQARHFLPRAHATFCRTFQYDNNLNICTDTYSHTGCYVVIKDLLSRHKAQEVCAAKAALVGRAGKGALVSISSQSLNEEMDWLVHALWSKEPDTLSMAEFWVGGYRDVPDLTKRGRTVLRWAWSDMAGFKTLAPQGCYVRGISYGDFNANYQTDLGEDTSPKNCTAHCSSRSGGRFAVAGLQRGRLCLCGTTYGALGGSNQCTEECLGSRGGRPTVYCGGNHAANIYIIGGAPADWDYSQPNTFDPGNRACAVVQWNFDGWRLASRMCNEKKVYICETNAFSPCFSGLLQNGHVIRPLGNKCLRISLDYSAAGRLTWFDAQEQCSRRGQLLTLVNKAEHEQLKAILHEVGLTADAWVGLVGLRWTWPSGARFLYHNFDPFAQSEELNDADRNCMTFRQNPSSNTFFWGTQRCQLHLPSICRIDMTTTVTAERPTTASLVTDSSTAGDSGGVPPDTGASTANTGLSTDLIVVIAVVAVLLLIGLIIVVVVCCYCKTGKTKQSHLVHPEKTSYLASSMLIPYNQYYNDEDYSSVRHPATASGVVLNPAYLTRTVDEDGEDHAYMSYVDQSGKPDGVETMSGYRSPRARVYSTTESGVDIIPQHGLQTSMTSYRSGPRLVSRDVPDMTVRLDGTLVSMKN